MVQLVKFTVSCMIFARSECLVDETATLELIHPLDTGIWTFYSVSLIQYLIMILPNKYTNFKIYLHQV